MARGISKERMDEQGLMLSTTEEQQSTFRTDFARLGFAHGTVLHCTLFYSASS